MPLKSAVVLLALATAAAMPPAAAQQRYQGVAQPAGGGPVLYREIHWLYRDAGVPARLVHYTCPDGRVFARKRLRDRPSSTAPTFDFVDARSGYREGVRLRGALREVYGQPDARATMRVRPWTAPADTVVDAGFDAFVREHWTEIDSRGLVVPFLIPSRFEAMNFRIRDAGTTRENGHSTRHLRMGLAGLLGLALPDVLLTYDATDRRLLRFEGPGNVRDARGRMQNVRIDFPAPPSTTGASPAALDAALAMPLVTTCTS